MQNEEMISYSFDMIQMNCFVVEENGETLLFQCTHMLESVLLLCKVVFSFQNRTGNILMCCF